MKVEIKITKLHDVIFNKSINFVIFSDEFESNDLLEYKSNKNIYKLKRICQRLKMSFNTYE